MCEVHAEATTCILSKSEHLVHNPTRHPRGSLTDPHPKFPQAETSAFLFPGFLIDAAAGEARPIVLISVAFSLLAPSPSAILSAVHFLRWPEKLVSNSWEPRCPPPHP